MLHVVESQTNALGRDRGVDSGSAVLLDGNAKVLAACASADKAAQEGLAAQKENAVLQRQLASVKAQLEVHKTMYGTAADVETIDLSYNAESADSSHVSCTTSSQHSSLQSTGTFSNDQSILSRHGDVDISAAEERSQDGSSCTVGSIDTGD